MVETGRESNARPPRPYVRCRADYDEQVWDWGRAPGRSLVVCAAPRSGSTWLCEMLADRGYGTPIEYFNPLYVRYLCHRWRCSTLGAYRLQLWRHRTTADGWCAGKLLAPHFFTLDERLFAPLAHPANAGDAELPIDPDRRRSDYLQAFFPRPTYLRLRRKDTAGQAVSYWLAQQTGVWMQWTEQDPRQIDDLAYDLDAIAQSARQLERYENNWDRYFRVNAITPIEVGYEDMTADPAGTLDRITHEIGNPPAPATARRQPAKRHHRQRSEPADALVDRYRSTLQQTNH